MQVLIINVVSGLGTIKVLATSWSPEFHLSFQLRLPFLAINLPVLKTDRWITGKVAGQVQQLSCVELLLI